MASSALSVQVGGDHYKSCAIQPVQFIEANGLRFLEGCIVKRVTRHDSPTGKGRQDIEKAIHELQLLLELRYSLPDVTVRNDSAPTHPAWPDDKAYRWMAQDLEGSWCAYTEKPVTGPTRGWQCVGAGDYVCLTGKTVNNPNWRDTLIERGGDKC